MPDSSPSPAADSAYSRASSGPMIALIER